MKPFDWPLHLRAFRKRHKLSQQQLAKHLKTSTRNVQNWEQRRSEPDQFLKYALLWLAFKLREAKTRRPSA